MTILMAAAPSFLGIVFGPQRVVCNQYNDMAYHIAAPIGLRCELKQGNGGDANEEKYDV